MLALGSRFQRALGSARGDEPQGRPAPEAGPGARASPAGPFALDGTTSSFRRPAPPRAPTAGRYDGSRHGFSRARRRCPRRPRARRRTPGSAAVRRLDGARLRPRRSSCQTTSTSPLPQRPQAAVESRPVVANAGAEVVVEVDRVVDANGPQGVALQVQRLGAVGLRDAGVADPPVSQRKFATQARTGEHLHPRSDHDAFDLVDGHRVRRLVVELRRLRTRALGVLRSPGAVGVNVLVRSASRNPRGREDVRLDAAAAADGATSTPAARPGCASRTDELVDGDRWPPRTRRRPPRAEIRPRRRDRLLADAPSAPLKPVTDAAASGATDPGTRAVRPRLAPPAVRPTSSYLLASGRLYALDTVQWYRSLLAHGIRFRGIRFRRVVDRVVVLAGREVLR